MMHVSRYELILCDYISMSLQFLTDFLAYLKVWEKSVKEREGFSDAQKRMMTLPRETQDGIHITGKKLIHIILCTP